MATHSNILAWRIQWTEESGGLQPIGSQRVGRDWTDLARTAHICWYVTLKIFFSIDWNMCAADTVSVQKKCIQCCSELPQRHIPHTPSLSLMSPWPGLRDLSPCLWAGKPLQYNSHSSLLFQTQLDFSGNHIFADLSLPILLPLLLPRFWERSHPQAISCTRSPLSSSASKAPT